MSNGETQFMIHQLHILKREVPLEDAKPNGEQQLAVLMKLFHTDIDLYIEKLRRLDEYEREAARIARTYSLRDAALAGAHFIPD